MKIYVTDIDWDGAEIPVEELDLPSKVTIDNPSEAMLESARHDDFYGLVCEYLSDEYDCCVKGFSVEVGE